MGQSHNHWTRSFNEESSLLSGAVVGGGAGPAAIYYNPSSIGEITESKISVNASLFSFDSYNAQNALGDGIDIKSLNILIEPRFMSVMIKPEKHPEWSLEIAFLNNENYNVDITQSVDYNIDVLNNLPGEERYHALFQFSNKYRDDWLGFGGSWKLNPNFYIGASMFVSIRQLEYRYLIDIEAFPLDSVIIDDDFIPFYSAHYYEMEYVKYTDYRLLWKFGLLYTADRFSIGLNITTPSIGGIYSDYNLVSREQKQSYISMPESGEPLPDYEIVDYREKKDVFVNSKSPLSIAAGFTYYFQEKSKTLYITVEYFAGLDPFRLVQAEESLDIAAGSPIEELPYNEWLTFVGGAKPVLNAAAGYRWKLKENLMILGGFRTDFNYRKDYNYDHMTDYNIIRGLDLDLYHLNGGFSWRILGQDLMIGFQYTLGRANNQKQYLNLSDPVEYNMTENVPLQGTRQNTMKGSYNSLSVYFGATFNIGGGNKN